MDKLYRIILPKKGIMGIAIVKQDDSTFTTWEFGNLNALYYNQKAILTSEDINNIDKEYENNIVELSKDGSGYSKLW